MVQKNVISTVLWHDLCVGLELYLNIQVHKQAQQTIGFFRESDPSLQLCRKRLQHGRETPVFVLGHNHQHSHNILPPRFNGQREEKGKNGFHTVVCF